MSVTAADYIAEQLSLERQAREIMPYDPEICTYPNPLRQVVFACLTCAKKTKLEDEETGKAANAKDPTSSAKFQGVGVCYLCLIQCHSTHELVELFARRNFACDCGTTRSNGTPCTVRAPKTAPAGSRFRTGLEPALRRSLLSGVSRDMGPVDDIECLDNVYNHNFAGRFCSCDQLYDPHQEVRTMHQCYLGAVCGEDWFHQDCILGYTPGLSFKAGLPALKEEVETSLAEDNEENLVAIRDSTPVQETPQAAESTPVKTEPNTATALDDDDDVVPHFPALSLFSEYICWQCVDHYRSIFDQLSGAYVKRLPHFTDIASADKMGLSLSAWHESQKKTPLEPPQKKFKAEATPYSVLLADDFRPEFNSLQESLPDTSDVKAFLKAFPFLTAEETLYQPPEEDVSLRSSEGSLYDLGSLALLSLPVPQAIEGLQAYDTMKEKLRGFLKGFVEKQKVVTEEEVRDFFRHMKDGEA